MLTVSIDHLRVLLAFSSPFFGFSGLLVIFGRT